MDESVQIIELKQLPVIEERLRTVKREIEARTQEAMNLVCSEETCKSVKQVRADLQKQFTELEEQRKAMKRMYMAPYEQFEALYKECVTTPFSYARTDLTAKINAVENDLKDRKMQEVKAYYEELCSANGIDWLVFERTGIKVTLTASVKSLKQQAKTFVSDVANSIATINTMDDRDEILVEYKRCLELSSAILRVKERKEAIKAERERNNAQSVLEAQRQAVAQRIAEQTRKELEAQESHAHAPVAMEADPEQEPEEAVSNPSDDRVYETRFAVRGTLNQLKKLKAFMESEGLTYESV